MAYELAGARILTPVVGSSSYVWTSIIGVIIAALSAGYILGGYIADKRARHSDLAWLLLAAAGGTLLTLVFADPVLNMLASVRLDIRLEAVLASIILFAPTSVILGAISPYVAKLHTASLNTTGRSIALLSALNSLGGIVGTFLTGFVFFGYIGSRQTLGGVAILLALTSLLCTATLPRATKAMVALLVLSALLLPSLGGNTVVANVETSIASYEVHDLQSYAAGHTIRVLTMGPGGYQSGIDLGNPDELVFGYTQRTADITQKLPTPDRILVLGGGTFTMPTYFARTYPDSHIDVVELDAGLTQVARDYFAYNDPANVTIINEDARTYLERTNQVYDLVVVDVFSDAGIPFSMTTQEFAHDISRRLTESGVVVMNIIAADNPDCAPLLQSITRSFDQTFPEVHVMPVTYDTLDRRQNILLAASHGTHDELADFNLLKLSDSAALSLTDNFAPIERIHHQCFGT